MLGPGDGPVRQARSTERGWGSRSLGQFPSVPRLPVLQRLWGTRLAVPRGVSCGAETASPQKQASRFPGEQAARSLTSVPCSALASPCFGALVSDLGGPGVSWWWDRDSCVRGLSPRPHGISREVCGSHWVEVTARAFSEEFPHFY